MPRERSGSPFDGTSYEIDLNAGHTSALRSALAVYVAHARKVGPIRIAESARSGTGSACMGGSAQICRFCPCGLGVDVVIAAVAGDCSLVRSVLLKAIGCGERCRYGGFTGFLACFCRWRAFAVGWPHTALLKARMRKAWQRQMP
jgi:hypothetical protein